MIVEDIQPQTNIEWLWTLDLVELSWEILRYRRLKRRAFWTSIGRSQSKPSCDDWTAKACLPRSCQWWAYTPKGQPQNGATIEMPPTRPKLACAETSLIPSISMPKSPFRRAHHLRCSIDLPIWRRPGVLDCSGRSAYDGNSPGASLGSWTVYDFNGPTRRDLFRVHCIPRLAATTED